jgi:hypothetical protein
MSFKQKLPNPTLRSLDNVLEVDRLKAVGLDLAMETKDTGFLIQPWGM